MTIQIIILANSITLGLDSHDIDLETKSYITLIN